MTALSLSFSTGLSSKQDAVSTNISTSKSEEEILSWLGFYTSCLTMECFWTKHQVETIAADCKERLAKAGSHANKKPILEKAAAVTELIEKIKRQPNKETREETKGEVSAISNDCAMSDVSDEEPEDMIEFVKSSKYASLLLGEAMKVQAKNKENPRISVEFIDLQGEMARTHLDIGLIEIEEAASFANQVAFFMFELTNIIQDADCLKVWQDAEAGKIDEETFVRRMEEIEYRGVKRVSEVFQKCIRYEGWEAHIDIFRDKLSNEWSTFEKYYADQKIMGHADRYRNQYKTITKA